jgi:hypothetical protein
MIGPQRHAQHCHSQSKPTPRKPHPSPTRTPSAAPKLAYGSPAAAAARLGVVEVGALESGLRVDLHLGVVTFNKPFVRIINFPAGKLGQGVLAVGRVPAAVSFWAGRRGCPLVCMRACVARRRKSGFDVREGAPSPNRP